MRSLFIIICIGISAGFVRATVQIKVSPDKPSEVVLASAQVQHYIPTMKDLPLAIYLLKLLGLGK